MISRDRPELQKLFEMLEMPEESLLKLLWEEWPAPIDVDCQNDDALRGLLATLAGFLRSRVG